MSKPCANLGRIALAKGAADWDLHVWAVYRFQISVTQAGASHLARLCTKARRMSHLRKSDS